MKRQYRILCAAVVAAALTPILIGNSWAVDAFVAVAMKVVPPVFIQSAANPDEQVPLQKDIKLYPGDRIICGDSGEASLIFADSAVEVKLLSGTELTLQGQRTDTKLVKRLFIQIGRLLTKVRTGEMEVVTPTTVASVKGTSWWTWVDLSTLTKIIVLEGEVQVQNRVSGAAQSVSAGNTAVSEADGELDVKPTKDSELPDDSGMQQGSLEIEFEDESGQKRTLTIEFDQ
ncbi:MAG: FecR domain-containing protein [bacterium]